MWMDSQGEREAIDRMAQTKAALSMRTECVVWGGRVAEGKRAGGLAGRLKSV